MFFSLILKKNTNMFSFKNAMRKSVKALNILLWSRINMNK